MLNPFPAFKPVGVTISDTYNHPDFPVSLVEVDKSTVLNLPVITKALIANTKGDYALSKYLPFHYIIEFYRKQYILHYTRPIDTRYPVSRGVFNPNHIHIVIMGNTDLDTYLTSMYNMVFTHVLSPVSNQHKIDLSGSNLNMSVGKNFMKSEIYNRL